MVLKCVLCGKSSKSMAIGESMFYVDVSEVSDTVLMITLSKNHLSKSGEDTSVSPVLYSTV